MLMAGLTYLSEKMRPGWDVGFYLFHVVGPFASEEG